jgi:hypothetical protein
LILASIFAVAVVSLSFVGEGPGALLSFLLFVVGPLIALYFIVKSAVWAGVVAANKAAATPELRTAREILNTATPAARSDAKTTRRCGRTSKPRSRPRV